jgi:hypothetical protein
MVIAAAVQAYLLAGALVALGLHLYAERLATPHPDRLCAWCRAEREHMARVNGPLLAARGPGPWLLMLAITMLAWPPQAAPVVRRRRPRGPPPPRAPPPPPGGFYTTDAAPPAVRG